MKQHHLHPIEEQTPKQKPDLHRRKVLVNYHQFHQCPQAKKHLEVKIILNLHTGLKDNQVGRQILKDHLLLEKMIKKENPKHDTEKGENITRAHWRKTKRVYIMNQLFKYGWE